MRRTCFTERDGHDDDFVGESCGEECPECGGELLEVITGSSPPTLYEPGEMYGYFTCPECGYHEDF